MARLNFPDPSARFEKSYHPIPDEAVDRFKENLRSSAATADHGEYELIEKMKSRFGMASSSTDLSWARHDLGLAMNDCSRNCLRFIEALWLSTQDANAVGADTLSLRQINEILKEHNIPYELAPPDVRARPNGQIVAAQDGGSDPTRVSAMLRYTLVRPIRGGAYGDVHLATYETATKDKFECALKLHSLHPWTTTDPEKARARFSREVRTVSRLQHRGIVPYIDAGFHDGHPFLVMPYISGPDLREYSGSVNFAKRSALMVEILNALAYAHQQGVMHRDLKPSNILVRSSDHQPIIVDFGLAYVFDDMDGPTLTASTVGSAGYIPSEVLANPTLRTPSHDIYSCGIILYEIIAGCKPDPRDYKPLVEVGHESLAPIDGVVLKAIAPASTRYPSAADFRDALRVAGEKLEDA